MTKEEIKYSCGLIATFMDMTEYPENSDQWAYNDEIVYEDGKIIGAITWHRSLAYNKEWNWIMPVIRKINGLGKEYSLAIFKNYISCTVEKGGKFYKDFSFSHAEYITGEQDDITAAFKLVVKFIEWYNVNIKIKQELQENG